MSKKLLFNLNKGEIQNYTYVKYVGTIITATNTLEKPIKSATLKGQTLMNLVDDTKNTENKWIVYGEPTIDENGVWYFESNRSLVKYVEQTIPVKNNTTYTAFLKCKNKNTNETNVEVGLYLESTDGGSRIVSAQQNILSDDFIMLKCKITTTTHNSIIFRLHARGLIGYVWFKEPMFVEGDYTNVDIPYFETMQSVKMPVLTTSSEDGSKTNILSVSSDLTLRSKGITFDELNILTGKLTQRIDEGGEILNEEIISFVELTITDQDDNIINQINSFDNTTHIITSSDTIPPIFEGYIATKESVE